MVPTNAAGPLFIGAHVHASIVWSRRHRIVSAPRKSQLSLAKKTPRVESPWTSHYSTKIVDYQSIKCRIKTYPIFVCLSTTSTNWCLDVIKTNFLVFIFLFFSMAPHIVNILQHQIKLTHNQNASITATLESRGNYAFILIFLNLWFYPQTLTTHCDFAEKM